MVKGGTLNFSQKHENFERPDVHFLVLNTFFEKFDHASTCFIAYQSGRDILVAEYLPIMAIKGTTFSS